MRLLSPVVCYCFLVLAGRQMTMEVYAAALIRGPYLQIAAPDGMTVRWRTEVATESIVRYGPQPNELTFSAASTTASTEHEVRLTGLIPAAQYFYSVGSPSETLAQGPEYHFFTSPLPGKAKPTRIWVIGDSGQTADDGQLKVRDAYYRFNVGRPTDVWLALGDNAYYEGTDAEYQTNFFDIYPKLLPRTAIWSALGNHETFTITADGRFPYFDIFSFPTNAEAGGVASGSEEYYSFDYANIHFICLDSTWSDPSTNGPMADWLRADLAATTSDWIIAYWHHPPYTKGIHDSDIEGESTAMRQNILPILEARGVDLVLSGHSHVYERSFLLRGHYGTSGTLQPDMILDQGSGRENDTGPYIKPTSGPMKNQGTVYVEAGSSGYARDSAGHHPVMFADVVQRGSMVLDINGNRLDAVFLRDTGAVGDSFTILKGEPEPLRLLPLVLQNGQAILRWKSIRGHSYRVEHSDSWQTMSWHSASDPITAVGATTAWTNPIPAGPVGLYRVVEIPLQQTTGTTNTVSWLLRTATPDQRQSTLLTVFQETQSGRHPVHPGEGQSGMGEWQGEAVVCDTTYWRRRVKPPTVHSTSRARMASEAALAASHLTRMKPCA